MAVTTTISQQNRFSRPAPDIRIESEAVISRRGYFKRTTSLDWNLIWEAGPYYERVALALENAHSYAIFVGWQVDSRLELTTKQHESFKDFIIRLCTQKPDFHAYFLMWDHAYFYMLERELMQEWVWDNIHDRVHFVFDNRHPYGAAHHEKFVVVDGEVAFVGGVDICADRWDTPLHLYYDDRRSLKHDHEEHYPYHDMSVEVRGEVAADLVDYIGDRWRALSTIPFPDRPRMALLEGRAKHHLLISRTKASVETRRPVITRETEFLFRDLIRSTERELIIEQQYYWSAMMNEELMALMKKRAGQGLRILLVVPPGCRGSAAFRMMGVYQTELLDKLIEVAAETRTELILGCPYVKDLRSNREKPIYVHSKVLVVDDRFMAIGSANFNNRGFRLDTELTLTLLGESEEERANIRAMSRQIVAHWGPETFSSFYKQPPMGVDLHFERQVSLAPYHEAWDGYLGSIEARFARLMPIIKIFDPMTPFAYYLKCRLALVNEGRIRKMVPVLYQSALMLAVGASLLLITAGQEALGASWKAQSLEWLAVLTCALSASWLFRIPILIGCLTTGFMLGARPGALVAVACTVVAIFLGYAFGRLLPLFARSYYASVTPQLSEAFGHRRLPLTVKAAMDPRLSFQKRAAYQGIYSIPVRWLVLASIPILLIHGGLAVAGGLFSSLVPWSDLSGLQIVLTCAFLIMAIGSTYNSLRRLDSNGANNGEQRNV